MKRRNSLATDCGFIAFCALVTGIGYGIELSQMPTPRERLRRPSSSC